MACESNTNFHKKWDFTDDSICIYIVLKVGYISNAVSGKSESS